MKIKKFIKNPLTTIGLAVLTAFILMLLGFSISNIGSIGTFIAALIAAGTLFEIRRQRIAAQKPRLVFGDQAHCQVDWRNDKNGINSKMAFDMINAGRDIALNIQISYNWNINELISIINKHDYQKESPFTLDNGIITMSLNSFPEEKYIFDKPLNYYKLEYLLPISLDEKPHKSHIPKDFVALVSFLAYLLEKENIDLSIVGIPTIYVKISFEDVFGNLYFSFRKIYLFYSKKIGIDFYMTSSTRREYNNAHVDEFIWLESDKKK